MRKFLTINTLPLLITTVLFASFCFSQPSTPIQRAQPVTSPPNKKAAPQLEPYKVVKSLRETGRLEEAKQKALQYLQLKPTDVDVMLMLGIIYYQEKQYVQAEKYFLNVIAIAPKYSDAYLLLAKARLARNDHLGALDIVNKGLRYFPNNKDLQKTRQAAITPSEASQKKKLPNKLKKNPSPIPLTCCEILAKCLTKKSDFYFSKHSYYQAADFSKSALKCDPCNKQAQNILKEINGISPKYAVGVNEIGFYSENDQATDIVKGNLNQVWDYSTLYYSRDTKLGQVIASINYAERLGHTSGQGELEFLPVFNEHFILDLDAAYANQPNLFPNYRLSAEGYFYFPKFIDFSLGGRYANIDLPFYRVYTGSLSKQISDRYWVCFRPYHFIPGSGSSSTFYTATLRRYFGSTDCSLGITLGYGRSPDLNNLQTVDFIVIDNRTVNIDAEIPICSHRVAIILGADYQRQIYPSGLIRTLAGGTAGLKFRF